MPGDTSGGRGAGQVALTIGGNLGSLILRNRRWNGSLMIETCQSNCRGHGHAPLPLPPPDRDDRRGGRRGLAHGRPGISTPEATLAANSRLVPSWAERLSLGGEIPLAQRRSGQADPTRL